MSEPRKYAASIRAVQGVGLEVDMRDFEVVRLQSGEKTLWYDKDNRDNLLFDKEGQLGQFLARFTEQRESPDVAVFEYKRAGREFASKSLPIDPLKGIPEQLKRQLELALQELQSKAEDPKATEEAREFINSLRLADPKSSPDMYRLYKDGSKDLLLVLWGCNRRGSSPLLPLDAIQRIPTYRTSALPKILAALAAVAVLLLLLLMLSLFFRPGKDDERATAVAGNQPQSAPPSSTPSQSLPIVDSVERGDATPNRSIGGDRSPGFSQSSDTSSDSPFEASASNPNVGPEPSSARSELGNDKSKPTPRAIVPPISMSQGDPSAGDIPNRSTNDNALGKTQASTAGLSEPDGKDASKGAINGYKELTHNTESKPVERPPAHNATVSSDPERSFSDTNSKITPKVEPIKPPYLKVSSSVLSLGEQITIEAKIEGWLTIDGHDELKAIDKTWLAPGKPAVRRLRAGIRTLQFIPDGEEYKGKPDIRAVAVYTPPQVAKRSVTILPEGNLDLQNLSVDWGDDSPMELLVGKSKFAHEYASSGKYSIRIVPPDKLSWAKKTFVVTVE